MNIATIACMLTASAAKRQSPEWALENCTISTHLPALVSKIEDTITRAECFGIAYREGVLYSSLNVSNEKHESFMNHVLRLNRHLEPLGAKLAPVNGKGPLVLVLT